LKDTKEIAFARNNLADSYSLMGKYKESIEEYYKALSLFEKLNTKLMIPWIFAGLGETYWRMKDAEKSRMMYSRQLSMVKDIPFEKAVALVGLGESEILAKNYKDAIPLFQEAILILRSLHNYSLELNALKGLAEAYENTGDYRLALENQRIAKAYSDTLINRKNQAKTAELQHLYEHEKAIEQILLLEKDKKLNRITIVSLGSVLAIGSVAILLFIARLRLKSRKDKELSKVYPYRTS
jgi:tetratricopeptide (TPR) repeat protein